MHGKVNCKFNDRGAWCEHEGVKRSLFGIGARCCIKWPPMNGVVCDKQEKHKRPAPPPPLPIAK